MDGTLFIEAPEVPAIVLLQADKYPNGLRDIARSRRLLRSFTPALGPPRGFQTHPSLFDLCLVKMKSSV